MWPTSEICSGTSDGREPSPLSFGSLAARPARAVRRAVFRLSVIRQYSGSPEHRSLDLPPSQTKQEPLLASGQHPYPMHRYRLEELPPLPTSLSGSFSGEASLRSLFLLLGRVDVASHFRAAAAPAPLRGTRSVRARSAVLRFLRRVLGVLTRCRDYLSFRAPSLRRKSESGAATSRKSLNRSGEGQETILDAPVLAEGPSEETPRRRRRRRRRSPSRKSSRQDSP